jgi:hypothetical protein
LLINLNSKLIKIIKKKILKLIINKINKIIKNLNIIKINLKKIKLKNYIKYKK